MKTTKLTLIAAAATLIVATSTASAQSTMHATVPFAFQVNSRTVLPAGDYSVVRMGGQANLWAFQDSVTSEKTMVSLGQISGSRQSDPARLEFQCADHCALTKIQIGGGEAGYQLKAPKAKGAEEARIVVVPLTRAAAE